jgi:hypothetical protein
MAMTFTLVSQLREQLSALVRSRAMQQREAEREKERLELEVISAFTSFNPKVQCRTNGNTFLLGRGSQDPWHACHRGDFQCMESQL